MPKRVPLQSFVVQRTKDGKSVGSADNPLSSVSPKIGEAYEFTDAELKQIEAMNPGGISAEGKVDLSKADEATSRAFIEKAAADKAALDKAAAEAQANIAKSPMAPALNKPGHPAVNKSSDL